MKTLSMKAIHALDSDNEGSEAQREALEAALQRMLKAGAKLDDAAIELMADGDQDEADAHFSRFDGYADASRILMNIFNGEDTFAEGGVGLNRIQPPEGTW